MANLLYPEGAEAITKGLVDLSSDSLRIALLNSTYTYSATDDFLDDIAGGERVALAGSDLTSVVCSNGNVDAADYTFSTVATGSTITSFVLYVHNASEAAARLIMFQDKDSSDASISLATNGGSITVAFNASGIFTI